MRLQGRVLLPVGTSSMSQQTLMCWNTLVEQVMIVFAVAMILEMFHAASAVVMRLANVKFILKRALKRVLMMVAGCRCDAVDGLWPKQRPANDH